MASATTHDQSVFKKACQFKDSPQHFKAIKTTVHLIPMEINKKKSGDGHNTYSGCTQGRQNLAVAALEANHQLRAQVPSSSSTQGYALHEDGLGEHRR